MAFVPRLSHFDIENERSSTNEFRVGPHLRIPSRAGLHTVREIGVLHTVLDFALHLDCSHLRTKYRKTWRSPQLSICDHAFKRRANTGSQRCRARIEHGTLRAIRKSRQQRVDQVLLDGRCASAYVPNIRTLRRYQVDFQSVRIHSSSSRLSDSRSSQAMALGPVRVLDSPHISA